MEWTRGAISASTIEWLSAHPERRTEGIAELVHGSHREPLWEYVTSASIARANLGVVGAQVGLHGHTHVPVAFVEDGERLQLVRGRAGEALELGERRALVNPGSVGQPRDGDPDASYLIWEPEATRVTWRRVPYDVAAVQRAIREAGLPPSLAARLSVGL
jgi:diadenosine tetraphosphatase ApaH/serine/threonine PP2A family protein phosphatase